MTCDLSERINTGLSLARRTVIATAALSIGLFCATADAETSLTDLRRETREVLKIEATLKESAQKEDAIAAICDLYVVLRSDSRYATSEMLRGDAAKLRRRLISIAERRENRLTREGVAKPAGLSESVDKIVRDSLKAAEDQATSSPAAEDPKHPKTGFAPAPLGSNPWELVELIQRVVAPDLWDTQGGPATIQYFAMRRVLVVSATTDVHEQIRDLLTALR